jgi:dTDP-4-dehydrorhamnose reductase
VARRPLLLSQSSNRPFLVTGANGLLGSAVVRELHSRGLPVAAWTREHADLGQPASVAEAFARTAPRAVIHCAGWTQVDLAEDQPDECHVLNVTASGVLAACAARAGASFLYISSGGVFDGIKNSPYDEHDRPAPRTVYHRSKYEGELAVAAEHPTALVARVGWLYGGDLSQKRNFVAARLREATGRATLAGDTGQWGSPTWTRDAARLLLDLLLAGRHGLCHVANTGMVTRHDYVAAILRLAGSATRVVPSGPFPRKADVPANEALTSVQLPSWGIAPLRPWDAALVEYLSGLPLRS